jgi:hypothetical protein
MRQEFLDVLSFGFGEGGVDGVAGKFTRSFFGTANGESDLGGVEELAGIFVADGAEQHAMGDAGDEVAAVVAAGERGQKGSVGLTGFVRGFACEPLLRELCAIGVFIGPGAAGDGGIREGGSAKAGTKGLGTGKAGTKGLGTRD